MRSRGGSPMEVLSAVALAAVLGILVLPALAQAREGSQRANCANNLRQLSLSLTMMAREHYGLLPAMKSRDDAGRPSAWQGVLDVQAIYPEYVSDLRAFDCPATSAEGLEAASAQPHGTAGVPYVYIGWVVPDLFPYSEDANRFERNIESMAGALTENPDVADADWVLEPPVAGFRAFYRLREGIERYRVTDCINQAAGDVMRSKTAILWDGIGADRGAPKAQRSANVLFQDGHVEFMECSDGGGRFPMNQAGLALDGAIQRNTTP